MNELENSIPSTVLNDIENKAKVYRDLSVDIDLSPLPKDTRVRVRMLLRLGHLLADEVDELRENSVGKALLNYTEMYQNISKQINENQKSFQQASNFLNEFAQKRVQSLMAK